MKVLIVEDDIYKAKEIEDVILSCCDAGQCEIRSVVSVNDALLALGSTSFDLIVADLVLPQMAGLHDTQDATPQWCEYIEHHGSAHTSSWIIMTGFADIAVVSRQSFARHGVAVVEYDDTGIWKRVLSTRVRERFVNPPLDFVIICALEKERSALQHANPAKLGDLSTVAGLDCRDVDIGSLKGVAVTLTEPGLVSAAIATVKASEIFKPRAIAMCGICGGVDGESELGDLIVPDVSWNYQTGKIVAGKLRPELMQIPLPPLAKTRLQQLANDDVSSRLRDGLFNSELKHRKILTPPMVSGSQVVADKSVVESIATQSRKVGALDMEVAAVFSAAHDFFNGGGIFFAAKSVVDMADEDKDDRYHEYGCILSARFVVEALIELVSDQ